jgi:hypothetical protein
VEVEGKVRDLVGQGLTDSQKLKNISRRLLGKRDSSAKKIRLDDVTELAYMYKDGSIFVNAEGREDLEAEAFFEGDLPIQRIGEKELTERYPTAQIITGAVTKDDLVRRLHEMTVKPPVAFSKILTNRFQVTELVEFLMPAYKFKYTWKGHSREFQLHGFTGSLLQ